MVFTRFMSNTDGSFNTVNGSQALYSNTIGSFNTANGVVTRSIATPPATTIRPTVTRRFIATPWDSKTLPLAKARSMNNTTDHTNIAVGIFALSRNTVGSAISVWSG